LLRRIAGSARQIAPDQLRLRFTAFGRAVRLLSFAAQEKANRGNRRQAITPCPRGKLMKRCAKQSIWSRFIGPHLVQKLGLTALVIAAATVPAAAQ